MFNFFHKKREIVIDCFTNNPEAYTYAPIIKGVHSFPDWWKNVPIPDKSKTVDRNIRSCYGLIELYKRSFIIEHWCDIRINVTEDKGYNYMCSSGDKPQEHPRVDFQEGFPKHYHMKLISPWKISEKSGLHFAFVGAEWNTSYPFKILPGVVEYKHQHGSHVNLMLPMDNYTLDIDTGTPLVHVMPLKEDVNFKIKNHLLTDSEYKKIPQSNKCFGGLRQMMKLKKRNENRESKCPLLRH